MNSKKFEVAKREELNPSLQSEKSIKLGPAAALDLTGLTETEIRELKIQNAKGIIDINKRHHELVIDTQGLKEKLNTMAQSTNEVAEQGSSVTITNVTEDSTGRTEIIMGTSEAAKKGKLTRSQAGGKDYTIMWAGLAVFIVVIVALMTMSN